MLLCKYLSKAESTHMSQRPFVYEYVNEYFSTGFCCIGYRIGSWTQTGGKFDKYQLSLIDPRDKIVL